MNLDSDLKADVSLLRRAKVLPLSRIYKLFSLIGLTLVNELWVGLFKNALHSILMRPNELHSPEGNGPS